MKAQTPKLNPLAVMAMRRFRDELLALPCSNEVSEVVACLDKVLSYEGGRL